MSHPDDYISRMPFYGDETGEVFALKNKAQIELDSYDQSFETQSGFLILVRPINNSFSLSFKRQLGTPPTSSIFLTPDEAIRLANILGCAPAELAPAVHHNIERRRYSRKKKANAFMLSVILFIITVILCAVTAIIIYKFRLNK